MYGPGPYDFPYGLAWAPFPLYGPPHDSEVFWAHGVEQRDDGPRTEAGFKPSPPQHSAVMWRKACDDDEGEEVDLLTLELHLI